MSGDLVRPWRAAQRDEADIAAAVRYRRLHSAQLEDQVDAPDMMPRPPPSAPVIRTIAMPADTNPAGDIFGGWLMAQMDLAAGNVAARRARGRCATVAVESMTFYSPVFVGDEVSLYATITGTGRSSISINVEAWRRDRTGDDVTKVTQAAFTFVAIDEARKSRPLPEPRCDSPADTVRNEPVHASEPCR